MPTPRIAFPLGLLLLACSLPAATRQPNVIVILADDMGYSDIGCFGSEIATPNLDALAAQGLRFTQVYNNGRCCPTRASLLTGLYPHQAGIGHMVEDRGFAPYRGDLSPNSATLAEVLRPAGYRTYAIGKWHVTPGKTPQMLADQHNWPLQRGFDRYYGTINGSGSYWDPNSLVRDNREITCASDSEYQPKEYYYTDAITDQATRFIAEHERDHATQPFFLYVAYTAAHWPMHARERDIAKYHGRYDRGYGPVAAARWARQKQLGVVSANESLPPPAEDWDQVKDYAFEARCMEVYAAMIGVMDEGIGRMVAELKARGELDNTLICFLQDNGGCAEPIGRDGVCQARADHPTLALLAADVAQYGNAPLQTRDGWPVRSSYGVLPGPADTFISYGRGWANVSNTPFREYKHWVHEGGISTPMIVHWPAGIPAERNGRLVEDPGHIIDLMATCVDVARATYPERLHDAPITPMEGISLRPTFTGATLQRGHPIFWEHEGNQAVRDGRWKLVSKYPGSWELYDINVDRSEQHDLAATNSSRVATLAAQWAGWAGRVGVQPWDVIKAAAPAATPSSTGKLSATNP